MEDENLESGLDAVSDTEATDEAEDAAVEEGEMSPLEIARRYRQADVRRTQGAAELKKQLEAARNVLLKQPTEMSRSDKLLGIASTLLAPGPVGRAGTIGESLGGLGKYLSGVSAAEREAKQRQAEELAKFDTQRAQQEVTAATEEQKALSSLLGKYSQKKTSTSEFERLIADLPAEQQAEFRRQRAVVMSTRQPPKPEKPEADPDKPSSVVIGRVVSTRDRKLAPSGEKLGAVSQAMTLLNAARTNPAAVPQVDRFLARLTGDSQLSQLEVNSIANAGGFPQRFVSSISKFLSGIPSDLTLDQKQQVLEIIENQLAPQYNSQRESVLDAYANASDISPIRVNEIVGPRWVTSAEKKRKNQQEKTEAGVQPTQAAIDYLNDPKNRKEIPDIDAKFDEKYGAGASKKYLGK